MRQDDFPSKRQAAGHGIGWGLTGLLIISVLGLAAWGIGLVGWAVTTPVNMATGVVNQIMDPTQALNSYRWFNMAYQQVQAKEGQIALAKQALKDAAPDRKEARRVELLGVQEGCQNLVAEYNGKAARLDTGLFLNPQKYLPKSWTGDITPLPQHLDLKVCL